MRCADCNRAAERKRYAYYIKPQSIDLNAVVADKPAAVDRLVDLMEAGGNLADKALYKERVLARETEGSTGIGEGIAIPHAKTEAVKAPGLASMIVRAGVDYESLDEEPAFLFFLIAAPAGGENVHLEVLSRLSRMLMDDEFHEALMNAKTPEEYLKIIDEAEKIQIEQGGTETGGTGCSGCGKSNWSWRGCRNRRCRGSKCCSSCCRGSGRLR